MNEASQMDYIWVITFSLVPTFACGAMLRGKGAVGLLAVLGIAAAAALIFMNFEGTRLLVSGVAAMIGLGLGGQLSDHFETNRQKRLQDAERAKRDAKMRY